MIRRRLTAATILLALTAAGPACGGEDLEQRARAEVEERTERLRGEVRERTERVRRRIEEVLGQLEQAVPRAERTSPEVRSRGDTETTTIDAFLTRVLRDVDSYWTQTFAASGLPEPRVAYEWIAPGGRSFSRCGALADDTAAFYCPTDDQIFIGQRLAADIYQGISRGLPGEAAGFGRAAGDFGVAYIVAHEYAHNLQHELGLFSYSRQESAKPFELQADCMAGAWGSSAFARGEFDAQDVQEAIDTASAVGDFETESVQHHGTPPERRAAWERGFEAADPSVCRAFVPQV